jgi:hypothetical protein
MRSGIKWRTMPKTTTRQYLVIGSISAIVALIILPIAGIVSIYSGYKIYGDTKAVYSYLLAGAGGVAIVFWLSYLATI